MPTLSARLLDQFPYSNYASAVVIRRGQVYFEQNRAMVQEYFEPDEAEVLVTGDGGEYLVTITAVRGKPGLLFGCECPHADDGNFCKHMVAGALALGSFLKGIESRTGPRSTWKKPKGTDWQTALRVVSTMESTNPAGVDHYVAVILLEELANYADYGSFNRSATGDYALVPCVIEAPNWIISDLVARGAGRDEIERLLEEDPRWLHVAEQTQAQLRPSGCLNLGPEGVSLINALTRFDGMTGFSENVSALQLALLSRAAIPVFAISPRQTLNGRIKMLPDPVTVAVDFAESGGSLELRAAIEREGAYTQLRSPVQIICRNPDWALADQTAFQISNREIREFLTNLPIRVPAHQVDVFRKTYLANLAQQVPIRTGLVKWSDSRAQLVPRVYLRDGREGTLAAELRFAYDSREYPHGRPARDMEIETEPDTWDLVRVHRQLDRESELTARLGGKEFGLKRGSYPNPEAFDLRARVHPFDFLLHYVPRLAEAGFEIYGEEDLKIGKINRSAPVLRIALASGIDWFDLKAMVAFGDQELSLLEVFRAAQHGHNFVKLADGSAAHIPDEWLDRYRRIVRMAEPVASGLRLNDFHLPLIEPLLEADATVKIPRDLARRRERLRRFEGIGNHEAPAGFTGQLRPYQRHGLDWLYFLHDHGFGGILADDMGLGKTIQLLAFLQSLVEGRRRKRLRALLVVPKSLIANWQRETERFTPGLRLLVYHGTGRSRDDAGLDQHEIVLTTYGTVLRDIDFLRAHRFDYVILDESQATKNPLSKSAKAVRLLQADHRLALTGTPVENTTLELWSQFAFVQPGLLGNLDFFRSEFATPIESHGDQAAADLLRRLVYPFILRRTKDQVAPELPARTERIIYSDLDPAQKRLYNLTRDRYRAELLGLIDRGGLNDARFKILEGLLRLRQIAIHPRLIDQSYRGEAPKYEFLFETLETLRAEGHKVLIFSQFVEALRLARRELESRKIAYRYLDGKTANRQSQVDEFQRDADVSVFLISLKAGGVGLNLTAADYVVHLDPWWNPAVEMQASDRAHRIGQTRPVMIYKLITRGTVEEKVLALQEKKKALVTSLVAAEESFFKSLTRDDVKMLFE